MKACDDTHRLLARAADDAASTLRPEESAALDLHLVECVECRAALDEQRLVAGMLGRRPALTPSAGFAARLATRLDEASGWLGILDWRAWTFRLAPVALAIGVAAFFAGGASTSEVPMPTLEAWTRSVAEPSSEASAVWQDRTSSDALLDTMLSGGATGQPERRDVR